MGSGIGGDLVVKVVVDGDVVTSIKPLYHNETPGIGTKALTVLCDRLVEEKVVETDVVTGATVTSKALFAAVKDALGMDAAAASEVEVDAINHTFDLDRLEVAQA